MGKRNLLFIHGLFLNPKSWRPWTDYFTARGFNCLAPAWPFHECEPALLRTAPPEGLGELPLDVVIDKMVEAAMPYADDLVLIGHSVGGLIVQKLLSERIGMMGVPICTVAPNRMLSFDWGFFRNSASITNPLKGDAPFPMDAESFHKNFGNTISRAESDDAWERYAVPDSRNVLRDCMGDTGKIDVTAPHAPLLFISAEKDEIIPPQLVEKNAKAYTDSTSRIAYREFKNRGHFICGQAGWEEVATYIADWFESEAMESTATPRRRRGEE